MPVTSQPLRIVFAGTPYFAAYFLEQLLANSDHDIIAAYTQPDRPAGRGKKPKPSDVKTLAIANGIPVYQPLSLKTKDAQATLAALNADIMIVVAYGLLLPEDILNTPRLGCINIHGSLLPRWRGAAPIQRAIEAGDKESGITIMQMDKGLDTGDMLSIATCDITETDTSQSLHNKLLNIGYPALVDALSQLAQGSATPIQQDHQQANYAHKITKAEADINWQQDANTIVRKILAFNPAPVCYSSLEQKRIKIWDACVNVAVIDDETHSMPGEIIALEEDAIIVATGKHAIRILQLQMPGKKAMKTAEVLRGSADLFHIGHQFQRLTEDKAV